MINADGTLLEGTFVEGHVIIYIYNLQLYGVGVMVRIDGGKYEGDFVNGKKEGKGRETTKGITYDG